MNIYWNAYDRKGKKIGKFLVEPPPAERALGIPLTSEQVIAAIELKIDKEVHRVEPAR